MRRLLAQQALHDPLTGLINRTLLMSRIDRALSHRGRRGGRVAVSFIGLDRFKRVNDSLGHVGGDDLLVQVSRRLKFQLRAGDTLARFGSDEFVVLWAADVGPRSVMLSQGLVDCLTEPFDIGGSPVTISASVGVASTVDVPDGDELLLGSASAMTDAKSRGGNCVREFNDTFRAESQRQTRMEADLRTALSKSELVLHYQPVIDLDSGMPVGVEALVRWLRPDGRLVPPCEFIPVAEDTGLIVPLGRWVLNRACKDAVNFTGPAAGMHLSVNLSAIELAQPALLDHVRRALDDSGLDPARLFIEVTESALMHNEDLASDLLDGLTKLGIHIAVDDFGTGYSSLLYLRKYPITVLKLDRAFVSGIGKSKDDEAICRSVIALSQSLNLTAVAEGVETPEQANALHMYGCQFAQGFLWSPAVPLANLNSALSANPPRRESDAGN